MTESDDGRTPKSEALEEGEDVIKVVDQEGSENLKEAADKAEREKSDSKTEENPGFDDDDDFGDFEEASASVEPFKEPEDPFPETPTKAADFGFAKFAESPRLTPQTSFEGTTVNIPSMNELLNDEAFWDFEDSAATSMVESEVEAVEYFTPFDDGQYSDNIVLPKVYLESLKIWSEICFVEDTPALKFQWSKSKLYEGMLAALNMNSAKATPRETVSFQVMVPTSPLPLQLDLPESRFKPSDDNNISHQKSATTTSMAPTTTAAAKPTNEQQLPSSSSTALDSLSVEPVNFDWHSSGLSNPLTGASISDLSAILDCNYETKNDNNSDLLEKELERLGLGRSSTTPETQELTFGNNTLNLDDLLRPQTGNKNGNKVVAELSADAKALLNALPNYNFMLSKMLMFPVNK